MLSPDASLLGELQIELAKTAVHTMALDQLSPKRDDAVSILCLEEVDNRLADRTIVVVDRTDGFTDRRVMQSGAAAVIRRGSTARHLEDVIRAVDAGLVVLPLSAVGHLRNPAASAPHLQLSQAQRRLLALLAEGFTVSHAAQSIGCSDRQARRLLRRVWDELGARNRVEGMVILARYGLIEWVGRNSVGERRSVRL